MNKLTWIGTIVWGVFVTGFGLTGTGAGAHGGAVQPQNGMFLITGGAVTCLIGVVGLGGAMASIPGTRSGQ